MDRMRLYLMRHGDADRTAWDGDDFDRPLTDKGRARTLAMAEHLDVIGVAPRRVLTSPLTRTVQTAMITAQVLGGIETLVQDERMGPYFDAVRLAQMVEDEAGGEALVLVGHEPSLSMVISEVIGGGDVMMKKSAVACLEIYGLTDGAARAPLSGTLLWLLSPASLGF